MLDDLLYRLRALFRRNSVEADMDAELRFHLEREALRNRAAGMAPDEAHRQAQLRLGGLEQIKEECRDSRGVSLLDALVQDVRYGVRVLVKNPGFTVVVVLTLALGIGANSAIFSIVNAVLLRPLPFRDPDRLVMVWTTDAPRHRFEDVGSYLDFADRQAQAKSFAQIGAFAPRTVTLHAGSQVEMAEGVAYTSGFLRLLGVQPAIGRGLEWTGQQPPHEVILSDVFWRTRLAARPDIIGQTLPISSPLYGSVEQPFTIVGVMPPGFQLVPNHEAETVYFPLPPDPDRGHGFLYTLGRLRPDVSISQAQSEMQVITERLAKAYPKYDAGEGANVVPLLDGIVRQARSGLLVLLGVVTLVLLIACANVANLLLARITARRKEFAARAALGASRRRLLQQLLTESVVLSLLGGALGVLLANWAAKGLVAALTANFNLARLENTHTDASVLLFSLVISVAAGTLFGLVPGFSAASTNLNDSLREAGRTATRGVHGRRTRTALVITETALALILLAGAGLLMKSLLAMRNTPSGVQAQNLLAVDFWLPPHQTAAFAQRSVWMPAVVARVQQVPGVVSVAMVADLPMGGGSDGFSFHIVGRPDPAPDKPFESGFNTASAGYFRTMGIPVIAGREFTDQDGASTTPVIVINQTAARIFWPGENPLSKEIELKGDLPKAKVFTVVGVTADVHQEGLATAPTPEIFLNYQQPTPEWSWTVMVVRTTGDPTALQGLIRDAAASVNRDVPITRMRSMEQVLSGSMAEPRVYTALLGTFALLALVLAAIGLYGVVSYTVTQRTHEMGVRMALGASRSQVLGMVLRDGLGLALGGLLIGFVGALAATRVLTHLVRSVRPGDPLTMLLVSGLLMLVALLASYLPARRATRVNPVIALRHE